MKKIVIIAAVGVLILFLTKIANQMPGDPQPGTVFSLKAQQVVQCSTQDITLLDNHQTQTHLETDATWPDCAKFKKGEFLDFYLARGEKTRFISDEKTVWWRRAM
jgi:hypothetical protein